jgi:hypothetical protein
MQQNFFLSEMESGLDEWLKKGGVNFLLGKKEELMWSAFVG